MKNKNTKISLEEKKKCLAYKGSFDFLILDEQ
jgi:hypothetical protein